MIRFFFGMPGCGKTTLLCSLIRKEDRRIEKGKSNYKYILVNFPVKGFKHAYKLDFNDIGKYDYENALMVIDEGSVYCDNRNWKSFGQDKVSWFMLHRHSRCDIVIASQSYSGYDAKLRSITEEVYYVSRKGLLGIFWTSYYRIPYGIIIPDRKDNAGNKFGDIVEGYYRPPLLQRIFCKKVFRRRYFRHFDSFYRPLNLKKPTLSLWDSEKTSPPAGGDSETGPVGNA